MIIFIISTLSTLYYAFGLFFAAKSSRFGNQDFTIVLIILAVCGLGIAVIPLYLGYGPVFAKKKREEDDLVTQLKIRMETEEDISFGRYHISLGGMFFEVPESRLMELKMYHLTTKILTT